MPNRGHLGAYYHSSARPHDTRLLAGYVDQRRSERLEMIFTDRGDDRNSRVEGVGGVVSASNPDLDYRNLYAASGEVRQDQGGSQLERGVRSVLGRPFVRFTGGGYDRAPEVDYFVFSNEAAVYPGAFSERDQVWLSIAARTPSGLGDYG
jgi:hypothetical protein